MGKRKVASRKVSSDRFKPDHLAKLRRRRVWIASVCIVLLLASLILVDRSGWLVYEGSDFSRYDSIHATVVHVVDGDTIDIDVPDKDRPTMRLRLWGIDAPETAKPWRNEPGEPGAEEATAYLKEKLLNRKVCLKLEAHRPRDRFGRVLAFVYLDDEASINEKMVAEGLAEADLRWSHHAVEAFAQAEQQAKSQQQGIWAD